MTVHRLDAIRPEFFREFPWKVTARCATTAPITIATALNAGDSIDGVTLVAGDRVMLMGQSPGSENGLYVAGPTPVRSEHMCTGLDTLGSMTVVLEGTTNGGKVFKNTNTGTITIDTTALTFTEFGAGGGGGSSGVVINVMDYGAVEDFSTDNSTAFAAAIADMVPGCTLLFPSITGLGYKFSTTLHIVERGCLITGTGSEYGTRIHMTTANTRAMDIIPTALDGTRNQTNLVRGLLITGPGSASAGEGIYAASDVHIENGGVAGFRVGYQLGTASFYSRIYGAFITNCSLAGIYLDETNNTTIDTCRITGDFGGGGLIGPLGNGIVIASSSRGLANRIVNCSIEYFTLDGIVAGFSHALSIIGNYFETQQSSSGHAHIRVGSSSDATLIQSNYFQGDGTAGFVAIALETCTDTVVSDNRFGVNSAIGISSTGGTTNVLLWSNYNSPAGTFSLPASSYTLDPATPPLTNPMNASGSLIYGGTAGAPTQRAIGTTGQVLTVVGGLPVWSTPAIALDDLTDVAVATPASADRLRFDGSTWRNSALIWAPVMALDPGTGNYLVLTDTSGNAIMAEV